VARQTQCGVFIPRASVLRGSGAVFGNALHFRSSELAACRRPRNAALRLTQLKPPALPGDIYLRSHTLRGGSFDDDRSCGRGSEAARVGGDVLNGVGQD
jgi:hypothetical protein